MNEVEYMVNDFEQALATKPQSNMAVQSMTGRYMQEVQAMVFISKQFPRDQVAASQKIKEACSRKSLAKIATYSYPRGGSKISGPSIRLAEVLGQCWGNITSGVVELEQRAGESTCMAYAWDLESNFRDEKIFTVKHEMKANSKIKKLTDPRDIYELVANLGSRRKRACMLTIIPKDVVDDAVAQCEATLKGDASEPIIDRIKKMMDKFKPLGVTQEMVETFKGYKFEAFTEKDLAELFGVYNAIKDGIGKREDFFKVEKAAPTNNLEDEFNNLGGSENASS